MGPHGAAPELTCRTAGSLNPGGTGRMRTCVASGTQSASYRGQTNQTAELQTPGANLRCAWLSTTGATRCLPTRPNIDQTRMSLVVVTSRGGPHKSRDGVVIGDDIDSTWSREEGHGAVCGVVDVDSRGRRRIVLIIRAGPVELPIAQHGAAC